MINKESFLHLLDLYQEFTPNTAVYPNNSKNIELAYLVLGLLGERKEWLDSGYSVKEAGDIFWYCSQLCNFYNLSLDHLYEHTNSAWLEFAEECNIFEQVKKYIRDGKDCSDAIEGYINYMLAHITYRYNYFNSSEDVYETLTKVIILNRDKLIDRQNRDVLKGNGDNR